METKIKDITGAEITVTDLKEAVRQCRECLASPYLMPSGHTVGENHAYMLRQLLALQRRKREIIKETVYIKINAEEKCLICRSPPDLGT